MKGNDVKLKQKGRANSALRIGLRAALARFEYLGNEQGIKECRLALDRADRLERDDG